MQSARPPIPQREREHADETLQSWQQPPFTKGRQNYLGIGTAPERVASLFQGIPQRLEIVDLTVQHQHISTVCRMHRLVSFAAEVLDRKPTMAQGQGRI